MKVVVFVVVAVCCVASAKHIKKPSVMAVSRTPFDKTGAVDYESIRENARLFVSKLGVDIVFVNGGMSQFYQLTTQERKQIVEAWTTNSASQQLYIVAHVSHTDLGQVKKKKRREERRKSFVLFLFLFFFFFFSSVSLSLSSLSLSLSHTLSPSLLRWLVMLFLLGRMAFALLLWG